MKPKAAAKSGKIRGQRWQALISVVAISMSAFGYETWVLNRCVMKAMRTKPKVMGALLCKGTTSFITMSSGSSLVVPFQTRRLSSGGAFTFKTIAYALVFANGVTGHNQVWKGTTCKFLSSLSKVAFTISIWSVTEEALPRLIIFNFSSCGSS